jgi:glycosyltransferase involved in cell wall biosynthesis
VTRLAVLASHPVQYNGPLFRELAGRLDVHVFFAHRATPQQQADAGFGTAFDWDVDITSGYSHSFLPNRARRPGTARFFDCDTPSIGAELEAGKFDALMVLGWRLKSMLQGVFAARRLRIPVMVRGDSQLATARSPAKRLAKSAVYPGFLRLFDAALYVGRRSREYYRHYGYPERRLFFSPHCVDTRRFAAGARAANLRAELGVAPDAFVALFAGKLVDFKRPLDLLSAVAACRARGLQAEMMVAGSGVLEPALRAKAQAEGVPLHMLGFRNQSQMPAAYAAADCLVLPSSSETWGLVANEALACGTPVILSDACGSAPDLAADGSVGRVYAVGDVAALARQLEALRAAPPSPAAVAKVSEAYSLEAAAEGVCAALASLASAPRPRPA